MLLLLVYLWVSTRVLDVTPAWGLGENSWMFQSPIFIPLLCRDPSFGRIVHPEFRRNENKLGSLPLEVSFEVIVFNPSNW